MRRARKLGRRYIRDFSDVMMNVFRNPRIRELLRANITKNNAFLQRLMEQSNG
jgi:hypothetical protein